MKKLLILLIITASLTGCASTEYAQYSKAQVDIATAKATADTARYQALSSIAKDGDPTAKVAAVMALALGSNTQNTQMSAPQRSDALMWASILVPGITQAYAIGKSADVAINSSNNAAATSAATTAGFVGIASQIQSSNSTISTVTNTLSGTGSLGSGAYNSETPIIVPDVIQITPVVVPDVIQITPIVNEAPIL